MKIIIGNDHGALELKQQLMTHLKAEGHQITDIGVNESTSVDYPDIAEKACADYLNGDFDFGILLCGTGIGISIAANKINGIRAALPQNSYAAEMAKEHNNANFIVFGGRIDYGEPVTDILDTYIKTAFGGERHQRRINKITDLEKN